MSEQVYEVPAEWSKRAYVDSARYAAMYERSIKDPAGFWGAEAKRRRLVQAIHQGQEHVV